MKGDISLKTDVFYLTQIIIRMSLKFALSPLFTVLSKK